MAKEATTADIDVSNEMEEIRRAADSEGEIEVPLEDEGDDDDSEVDAAPQGPSRQEKKRQRGQNLVQQAREEAETARREAAELRGRLDSLERQRQQPPQQQAPTKDPLEDEAVAVRREHAAYVTRYQAALNQAQQEKRQLSQAEIDAYEKEGWDLKDRMDDLGYRRAAKRHQQPGISAQDIQRQTQVARVQQLHGDLLGTPKAQNLFMARWQLRIAEGQPDTEDTMNAAAESVRVTLGLAPKNGRPAPTNGQKARLSGTPKGGSAGAGDAAGGSLVLTKDLKRMADASLSHIRDPKERYKVFAKTVGKDLRKDGLA